MEKIYVKLVTLLWIDPLFIHNFLSVSWGDSTWTPKSNSTKESGMGSGFCPVTSATGHVGLRTRVHILTGPMVIGHWTKAEPSGILVDYMAIDQQFSNLKLLHW